MSDIQDEVQDNVPEVDDQTADMFADDEPEIDPDNPDGESPEETKPEPETLEISIEGFDDEVPPEQDTPVLKRVRDRLKEETRARKAAERALAEREAQSAPPELKLGEKPSLASCDFDDERFDRELSQWHERKIQIEATKRKAAEAEEARNKAWQARIAQYDAEKASLPVSDYAEAEEAVQGAFNQTQLGILVKTADKPAELVYALGKSERALEKLAALQDPIDFAVALGKIMSNVKTKPKTTIPAPERVVRGGGGRSTAATSDALEKARADGLRRGDLTEYYRLKEKAGR